jgi:hypothetical protein
MKNQIKLIAADSWNQIHDLFGSTGGIYKLLSIKNGNIVPIGRAVKQDDNGILYIGKANSFLSRVITLKKSILNNSGGHIAGRRYNKLPTFIEKFPPDSLYVILEHSDNPKALEDKYLNEYQKIFGEVPPLNAI